MVNKDITMKYWSGKKPPILIEAGGFDCFLHNEALNPMINWLNLYHNDIKKKNMSCNGEDKLNGVVYISINGGLMIKTNRDVVFLTSDQRENLVAWLNDHRKLLEIREVI